MDQFKKFFPWMITVILCIVSSIYFVSSKKDIATQKIELEASLKRLQNIEKSLADTQAALQKKDNEYKEKEKEYQELKLLY
jgi:peptidoglycan hydrolase CwlO-like protein